MEFLRDEDINEVESLIETSEDETIIDSGAETESRLGDPAVELETPEAWLDKQGTNKRETSGKRLKRLHIIGENRKYFIYQPGPSGRDFSKFLIILTYS